MSTIQQNLFQINGVIDTGRSVMDNINQLCTASGCWVTYDTNEGLWSVIINRPGSSVKAFNDSNIIGGINISGTGINELYNKVTVEFPHEELRDQTDYVDLVVQTALRFPNELDNTLNIQLQCINNPVQAQYIGNVELKQSRVDKVIEFRTDYSAIGLKAGDLIDVTTEVYGYVNKLFRIVRLTEVDAEGGGIDISVVALEYDEDVYYQTGITREDRTKKIGIIPKSINTTLGTSDERAVASQVRRAGMVDAAQIFRQTDVSEVAGRFNAVIAPSAPPGGGASSEDKAVWGYSSLDYSNAVRHDFLIDEEFKLMTVDIKNTRMSFRYYWLDEFNFVVVQVNEAGDYAPMTVIVANTGMTAERSNGTVGYVDWPPPTIVQGPEVMASEVIDMGVASLRLTIPYPLIGFYSIIFVPQLYNSKTYNNAFINDLASERSIYPHNFGQAGSGTDISSRFLTSTITLYS